MSKIEPWVDHQEKMIASKLFKIRSELGIEREELAAAIGIDYNELAKYEMGIEPVPASTLAIASTLMGVNMNYFYDDDYEGLYDVNSSKSGSEEISVLLN